MTVTTTHTKFWTVPDMRIALREQRRTSERRIVVFMTGIALTLPTCSDSSSSGDGVVLELDDVTVNPGQTVKTVFAGATSGDRAGAEGYLLRIDQSRRVRAN